MFFAIQVLALTATAATSTPAAQATPTPIPMGSVNIPSDGKWHYSVTPYVFLPQINGTFQFRAPGSASNHTINAHEPLSTYLPHVNALSMITAEARKDSGVIAVDYMWLNISTQKALVTPIPTNAGFRVTANILTVEAGGTIAHSDKATIDALIGIRSLNVNAALNWNFSKPLPDLPQSGTIAKSGTANDIVAAIRGKVRIGNRFYVPYYFDGGYGSDSSTAQGAAGLAYEEPWGDILLEYRALIYNVNPVSVNGRLTFNGLAIGASYKF